MLAGVRLAVCARDIGISIAVMVSVGDPSLAACEDLYPDTEVSRALAKPEYVSCSLDVMRADYATILAEEGRLLASLRPTYERRIKKDVGEARQKGLLKRYDSDVKDLATIAEQLRSTSGAAGGAPKAGPGLAKLLKQGKKHSQDLEGMIGLAKDELTGGAERTAYCLLDFHFRLGDGLHAKIRKCSP